jgi:hypothetical protein
LIIVKIIKAQATAPVSKKIIKINSITTIVLSRFLDYLYAIDRPCLYAVGAIFCYILAGIKAYVLQLIHTHGGISINAALHIDV